MYTYYVHCTAIIVNDGECVPVEGEDADLPPPLSKPEAGTPCIMYTAELCIRTEINRMRPKITRIRI